MTTAPSADPPGLERSPLPSIPQPAFKRLPRAVREQQMLDAAVKIFSRRGYHAASMDEIAEDAGISKPMVYAYLGSKEQLFIACLHREGTRLLEAIVDAVSPNHTERDSAPALEPPSGTRLGPGAGFGLEGRLWQGLRAFFGFVGAHRDGWAVLYRQARGEPPFAGELAGMRARIAQVVAGLLDRGLSNSRNGSVRADAQRGTSESELEVLAYALVGAAESLADWLVDHPDADPEWMADRVMSIAWLGADRLLGGATWRPR